MGHNNTWSKKMRALDRKGVRLVAAVDEWVDQPVKFAPDNPCDRDPWTLADGPESGKIRFNGSEIRPVADAEGNYVRREEIDGNSGE